MTLSLRQCYSVAETLIVAALWLQDCRTSCIYRIAQEGLPLLLPLLTKQVMHVRAETLLRQLSEGSIQLPESHRLPMDAVRYPLALHSLDSSLWGPIWLSQPCKPGAYH